MKGHLSSNAPSGFLLKRSPAKGPAIWCQVQIPTSVSLGCQLMLTIDLVTRLIGAADCCPWGATVGRRET